MSKKRTEGNGEKRRMDSPKPRGIAPWLLSIVVALVVLYGMSAVLSNGSAAEGSPVEFTDVRKQTREFMAYNKSISLTPEQEEVKREALSGLKAPCCADRTAYTCCCSCNMAQTWWGLSKHLIVNEGYDADQVRTAVQEWLKFINPNGFSGDACYTGGCGRPFHRNGCGGMDEDRVVF